MNKLGRVTEAKRGSLFPRIKRNKQAAAGRRGAGRSPTEAKRNEVRKICKKERLKKGLLKISEIAKEAGVPRSTVRYYTEMGLLPVAETMSPGGYRLYDREQTLARIQKIKSIAEQNRTLEDIREELTKSIAG